MRPKVPLGVTTSGAVDSDRHRHAKERARRWGLPFVERRRKQPLGPMLEELAEALLVFGGDGLVLCDRQGVLRYSPGMGPLRIKRIDRGARDDVMVRVAELRPLDHVLDCTLGMGADAVVAARVVGPEGRVVGVEKSLPLYALASEGLAAPPAPSCCPVEVVHADALEHLRSLPGRSFDCVLFDPMFDRPRASTPSFDVLRRYADATPLPPEALEEARRVARRWVLVKASRFGQDLARLGLLPEPGSPYADVAWGRVAPTP